MQILRNTEHMPVNTSVGGVFRQDNANDRGSGISDLARRIVLLSQCTSVAWNLFTMARSRAVH
ncbi:MAG: hypothetical protein EAZ30_10850 [Betaproteobacteria bacterium]|nr:MAG: hypothetical protein EAZ30_10850 [Betaproteobacteria bacterium]